MQPKLRCAVYTRKSTEEGLDQEFNSLDAQREACVSYITSQAGLGWKLAPDRYDDGGISGGTMDRPALQRLLQDIRERRIDVVVVYKIDRLTRSLMDFARIVEIFDASSVSFVSVTQAFNTTTSMGRLTLNVLLSFAQFEREVTAERIRDKIAASKKKGMWMGGTVPLGYQVRERRLVVREPEASFVRRLFNRYIELRSVPAVADEVNREAATTDPPLDGNPRPYTRNLRSGMLYRLLANPLYIGKVRHRANIYDGQHEPIVDQALFDRVQEVMVMQARTPKGVGVHPDSHLLTGMLYDESGDRLRPSHANNHGKRYRYYVSSRLAATSRKDQAGWRVPAMELENVVEQVAVQLLHDRAQLAAWIEEYASTAHVRGGLENAQEVVAALKDQQSLDRRRRTLRTMFRKIVLSPGAIAVSVDRDAVVQLLLQQPVRHNGHGVGDPQELAVMSFPMTLKRRGNGMRLVLENGAASTRAPDAPLVQVIASAHLYLTALTEHQGSSVADVAGRYLVHPADVSRILPLAFLSPANADAILTGSQPADLSARKLARADLPLMWNDQSAAFR